jgi:hypothetical protein
MVLDFTLSPPSLPYAHVLRTSIAKGSAPVTWKTPNSAVPYNSSDNSDLALHEIDLKSKADLGRKPVQLGHRQSADTIGQIVEV